MDEKTVRALNAINRTFYRANAADFDQSRSAPWPGWEQLLPHLDRLRERSAPASLRALDVGCGNARFGAFLAENRPAARVDYWGIDASAELIARAEKRALPFERTEFLKADFIEETDALPEGPFSLIALFGVLHHVPGHARREDLLRQLGERLESGGILALTTWQFEAFERFQGRLVPWREYNQGADTPIDTAQLERGDHLLPWGTEGIAHRYCHFTSEEDTRKLLEGLGFEVIDHFAADGREGNLNHYFICHFSSAQVRPKGGVVAR
jgi:tRNA (uracil-5-)-methyltransferase TRM9